MQVRRRSVRALLSAGALLGATLLACHSNPESGPGQPLFDGQRIPDVLVEQRLIESPPSLGGNRFVRGWGPVKVDEELHFHPGADGGWLQGVSLGESRDRELVLDLAVPPTSSGTIGLEVAGELLDPLPIAPRLRVPLPPVEGLGRFSLRLRAPQGVALRGAGFSRARPAGEAELDGADLAQQGWSLVELVRPVAAGTRLSGWFDPPAGAGAEEAFELVVEPPGGPPELVLQWRPGWISRLRGPVRLETELGPGLHRFKMIARGSGGTGRWRDLRLASPSPGAAGADALEELPSPPRVVILYVLDALRAGDLGALGGDHGATPNLDRLAREGVLLRAHRSVAPNTRPSTKSLFTGLPYRQEAGGKLPEDGPETLAEAFAGAGYRCGFFSGNPNASWVYGLTRGFHHFDERLLFGNYGDPAKLPYNDNAERVHGAVRRWLATLGPEERAFVYVHTVHPHNPYDPPEPYRSTFGRGAGAVLDGSTETLLALERRRVAPTSADQERLRGLYLGGLAYNDGRLAPLLAALQSRFGAGEVLLAVTSDHGEEFFEHGGILHGWTLYEEQLHVPLLLWWPGRLASRQIEVATDSLDLHATLRALAVGGEGSVGEGRSLWPLLLGGDEEPWRDPEDAVRLAAAPSVKGGIFSARSSRYKLIWAPRRGVRWGMGAVLGRSKDAEYFFDLEDDPGEQHNRAGEDHPAAAWLRSRLLAWVAAPDESGEEVAEVDAQTRAGLEALGYVD